MRTAKIILALLLFIVLFYLLFVLRTKGLSEINFQLVRTWAKVEIYLEDRLGVVNTNSKIVSKQKTIVGNQIGLGIYNPAINPKSMSELLYFEDTFERRIQYQLIFRTWGDKNEANFPMEFVRGWKDLGITPVITWEPWKRDLNKNSRGIVQPEFSLQSIYEGQHDKYIRQWASDAKNTNIPIIVRFAHEQSTQIGVTVTYPWRGDPNGFKRAYQRVYNIFKEEGADNVQFMWSPLAYWPDVLAQYYPGDGYVDLIGLSVLNHGVNVGEPGNRWKMCEEVFNGQYDRISDYKKKVMIVEFGSSEKGGNKSEWLKDCFRRIQSKGNIIGLVLLEAKNDTEFVGVNWGVDTSKKSFDTFKYELSVGNFK